MKKLLPVSYLSALALMLAACGTTAFAQIPAQLPTKVSATAPAAAPFAEDKAKIQFYDEHIRPMLVQNCYKCHTSEAKGGLRLDSRSAMLTGGDSGPAIVPHDIDKSLLIEAVKQTGELKMPPKGGKLPDSQIDELVAWIKSGAVTHPNEAAQPVQAVLTADAGNDFFENKIRPMLSM